MTEPPRIISIDLTHLVVTALAVEADHHGLASPPGSQTALKVP